jgi:tartrate dehydrogenase/decarboxylase/D-malate dehydrogenase
VEKVLAEGAVATPDLGGTSTTADLGAAITAAL